MSVFIDRKYLGQLSFKLEQFKQKKTDLYNFRCPYCGDSSKNKIKARGYIYRKSNDYFYICHNCSKSTTFAKFLELLDPTAYRQYILERYSNGESKYSNCQKPTFDEFKGNAIALFKKEKKQVSLDSIDQLDPTHYARSYIESRKIPEKYWSEIYFAPKYKEFIQEQFPEINVDSVPNDDRIVLLYTNEDGEITNVAGRALGTSKIRYCMVKLSEEKKLFGMHRMRKSERIYVVEGQLDSFFIPNCVASGDSNLCGVAEYLSGSDVVLIFDREPRNKEIVKQIEKTIEKGYTIALFPDSVPYKDINEMILGGMTQEEIMNIIKSNTVQGLTAKLKFVEWKKC